MNEEKRSASAALQSFEKEKPRLVVLKDICLGKDGVANILSVAVRRPSRIDLRDTDIIGSEVERQTRGGAGDHAVRLALLCNLSYVGLPSA